MDSSVPLLLGFEIFARLELWQRLMAGFEILSNPYRLCGVDGFLVSMLRLVKDRLLQSMSYVLDMQLKSLPFNRAILSLRRAMASAVTWMKDVPRLFLVKPEIELTICKLGVKECRKNNQDRNHF